MAQSVVGALRVNLGLDSAQFEKGVKRSKSATDQLARQMRRFAAVAATAFAGLGAAAIKGAQDIDAAAKASRRIGSSIGGFEALKLAASEAGVPLSSLPNELQNINRELANIGVSGNADRALDRLGISAQELANLDADEKIATIADRVKELGLSSGEATALLRDLGVRNREMVLLLQGGGEAIRQARQDVQDYGLALSGPAVAGIEQANDRIGRLTIVARVFGQQMGFAVVPALGRFAEKITDSVREGGQLRTVINALANVGRMLANVLDLVSENLDFLISLFKVFVAAKIVVYVAAIGRAMIVLARSIRATGLIMVAFSSILRVKITALALAAAVVAKLTGNFDNLADFVERTGAALEAALPESLRSGLDSLRESVTGLGDDLLGTAQIAENDFFNAEMDAKDAADSFGTASRGASKGVEELAESTELAGLASERYGSMASGAFADVILGAQSAQDAMKGLADQLLRMALDSSINNLFAALAGTGTGQGILGAIGGAFGGARAMGGPVAGGKTYLVGERGPELFTPSSSGGITPNHAMGGGTSRVVIELGAGLEGRILQRAGQQSLQLVQAGNAAQSRSLGGQVRSFEDRGVT